MRLFTLLQVAVVLMMISMTLFVESRETRLRRKFSKERERHAFLNHVLSGANHDGRLRPHLAEGKPTNVTVQIMLNAFGEFNEAAMDFSVDLILRQYWNDPRLAFKTFNLNRTTAFTLSDKILKDIWVPDLFFANEKHAWRHDITTPNVLVRISPSGDVLYSQRIKLKLACLYDFLKFPMDNQTCKIEMRSCEFQYSITYIFPFIL
ncbi:glycine receptor subunit alpha-1-like [Lingula anatina]|uniref:Glycine receptor subunit alpha-1-like n=1 Tax=Lingula anatina TaxID=7574 RepID=A0A1S3IT54_LINAN|nr:glycine receptor subunit alpha-1-like [Lingula anatina]|eukprot:XP_013401390.1 glycine receptor subunit alpha-1-like [Lingula anatina]